MINTGVSTGKQTGDIKQINYMLCQLEDHQTQPMSRICIDKECANKTLVCAICEQEKHKNHQTIPLKTFLSKFYDAGNTKKSMDNQNINPLYYADKIQEIKKSFIASISIFKNEINELLEDLETKAHTYFNEMTQKILLLLQLQNPLDILKKQGVPQSKVKRYFEQMATQFKVKQKFSLTEKLSSLFQRGQDKEKSLNSTLSKLKGEVNSSINKIQKSLDVTALSAIEKIKFVWSEQLKGSKMKIAGAIAQQTGMQSSGQRFIMMQPSLTDSSDSKLTWGIKIIKFVGWIGVGICLRNVITKANYFFNYSAIGHGSYMISNNGYSWSHSASDFNSAHKTFHYSVGDIIYIQYDRIAKKLRFRKNLVGEKFELDITDPPAGDNYHPCANICSTGDSVQIINPGISLS